MVSTARTPIGRANRGAVNATHGAMLAGQVIRRAVERATLADGEVEDVILAARHAVLEGKRRAEICGSNHLHRWRDGRSRPV
jgi:acetyl-CoA acetyltransferase